MLSGNGRGAHRRFNSSPARLTVALLCLLLLGPPPPPPSTCSYTLSLFVAPCVAHVYLGGSDGVSEDLYFGRTDITLNDVATVEVRRDYTIWEEVSATGHTMWCESSSASSECKIKGGSGRFAAVAKRTLAQAIAEWAGPSTSQSPLVDAERTDVLPLVRLRLSLSLSLSLVLPVLAVSLQ